MPRRRFNPPPNWPRPRAGWVPPDGWEPPAHWPDPPEGWLLWTEDPPRRRFTAPVLALIALGAFLLGSGVYAAASGPAQTGAGGGTTASAGTSAGPSASATASRTSRPPSATPTSAAPTSRSPRPNRSTRGTSGSGGSGRHGVPSGARGPYRVLTVQDGATVRVRGDGGDATVRLTGVEAPSTGAGDCYGTQSRSHLRGLLSGAKLWLGTDPALSRYDLQGHRLAYVWRDDGTFVNESVLRDGDARTSDLYASQRYGDRLDAAQSHARRFGRGLWSGRTCDGALSR